MPWWGYLILVVVVGFGLLFAIGSYMMAKDKKKQEHVIKQGDHVRGWVLMANEALYEADDLSDSNAAFVLIARDPEVGEDQEFMEKLVEEVRDIIESPSKDLDTDDEHEVHDFLISHNYREGKKLKIPKSITQGKTVFLCHLLVFRDDLPLRKITGSSLSCAICWDDPTQMICTRPASNKGGKARRRRKAEDD